MKATTWSSSSRRTLPIQRSATPFCHGLLGAVGGLRAERLHGRHDLGGEHRVAVEDEVPRSVVERERLAELLHDPRRRGVLGHVEPKDASSAMRDHEPDVQDPERHHRDGEEVHGCDHVAVVAQERQPARHGVGTGRTPR